MFTGFACKVYTAPASILLADTDERYSSRKAYGELAGWQSNKSWWDGEETYAGMVEVSRALMKVAIWRCPL